MQVAFRCSNWEKLGLQEEPKIYWSKTAGRYYHDLSGTRHYYKTDVQAKRQARRYLCIEPRKFIRWSREHG